jgi:Family of unknown function (DUF5683)
MGPGGLRGLQILLPGANHARGGFDSHASPPASRLVVAALVLTGLLGHRIAGAQPPLEDHYQSPSTAALKSFLLPGLGQVGNEKWLKAGVFFGAYAGLLGWAVALNQDKMDAEGHLNAAGSPPDSLFWESEVARLESNRNAKYWFAGATMLLSVIDAYVDAHLRGFDKRINATVGYVPEAGGAWALVLRTRWD